MSHEPQAHLTRSVAVEQMPLRKAAHPKAAQVPLREAAHHPKAA